ncbi:MAG TPA: OmpA family protein, partial [Polyangiaceae bacterium]|nr:OmpA family protein [Polyangiaceae bacterium]
MTRWWRLRAFPDDFEVEVGGFVADPIQRRESLEGLQRLLRDRDDSEVRRVLSEAFGALGGSLSTARADIGSRPEEAVFRWLESEARTGRLVVRSLVRPRAQGEIPPPVAPPLPPRAVKKKPTWFSLTVLDEVGRAVDGIDVTLTAAGDPLVVNTSGAGVARLDDIEGVSTVNAVLASFPAVRDKLKARWKTPRTPNIPRGDNVVVRALDAALDPVSLRAETPATLVLTPFFQCNEIPGSHFEFGRSFVRSDALDVLAGIAEQLTGDATLKAMIFGHTDRAGSEALNKELSERRGKALYALFTQDSGAWEELFSGTADGANWKEKWDVEEVQHMLNALGVTDDDGNALDEDGLRGPSTIQAIHRFQSGHYPDCPAEQAPLPASTELGADGRKELFLAYAKRVSRKPLDPGRFVPIGGSPFMGCGEYNPLSLSVQDAESRRAVVFVLDPAAGPANVPCKLRSIGPCQSNCGPLPDAPNADGSPPYRCKVYQAAAKKCPCQGGADLSHDLVVRIPYALEDADDLPHVFTLSADDDTISQTRKLSSDCRAADDPQMAEFFFSHLPETHAYTLKCDDGNTTYALFDKIPYAKLPDVLGGLGDPNATSSSLSDPEPAPDPDDDGSADPAEDESAPSDDGDMSASPASSDPGDGTATSSPADPGDGTATSSPEASPPADGASEDGEDDSPAVGTDAGTAEDSGGGPDSG